MKATFAAAQYPITKHENWENWRAHTEEWVQKAVKNGADVLIFPEYGSMELVSLFSLDIQNDIHRQVRELHNLHDDFCKTYADLAVQYNCVIIAPSLPVTEGVAVFNRVYVFSKKGRVGYQDKFFMTRFEDENWHINAAFPKNLAVFEAEWGRFGIQICYDSEFSIGSQLLNQAGANVIMIPSCTETIRGANRVHIGARARALENQCYTIVAQTVGNADWSPAVDINYGFAAFYTTPDKDMPEDGILSQQIPQTEGWLLQTLDFSKLENVRNDGQVFNFKDHKRIETHWKGEEIKLIRHKL
jgi:predicted amidohydrolase